MPDLTDTELSALLRSKNALVVHFSNKANMQRNGAGMFPKDMLDAVEHQNEWALSCCVVWPGHKMALPGIVGVIFDPTVASVSSVSNKDSGSYEFAGQPDQSAGGALTHESFLDTFEVKEGAYNEWRVKGAKFVGIFIDDIRSIYAMKEVEFTVMGQTHKTVSAEQISFSTVLDAFPNWSIYTIDSQEILVVSQR